MIWWILPCSMCNYIWYLFLNMFRYVCCSNQYIYRMENNNWHRDGWQKMGHPHWTKLQRCFCFGWDWGVFVCFFTFPISFLPTTTWLLNMPWDVSTSHELAAPCAAPVCGLGGGMVLGGQFTTPSEEFWCRTPSESWKVKHLKRWWFQNVQHCFFGEDSHFDAYCSNVLETTIFSTWSFGGQVEHFIVQVPRVL